MNKRHGVLHVRPEQYGGYGKKGCVRVMPHPTTTRKDSAAAQLVHYTLHHCMLEQTPVDPLPASPWSCRDSSSLWALAPNFQVPMDVLSFPQLEG